MTIAMLVMLVVVFGVVSGAAFVGFMIGRRQLPPSSTPPEDRRLAEQVELLEGELQRVKDQADFTERLLTERGDALPSDEEAPQQVDRQRGARIRSLAHVTCTR